MTKMNQAEAKNVQAIARSCRGPLLVSPKTMVKNLAAWEKLQEAGDIDGAVTMIEKLAAAGAKKGPPGFRLTVRSLRDDDGNVQNPAEWAAAGSHWEHLDRIALPLIRLRADRVGKGCGYDFNKTIVKYPADGAPHVDLCPKCDTKTAWTAPIAIEASAVDN